MAATDVVAEGRHHHHSTDAIGRRIQGATREPAGASWAARDWVDRTAWCVLRYTRQPGGHSTDNPDGLACGGSVGLRGGSHPAHRRPTGWFEGRGNRLDKPVDPFAECLCDWEFDEKWRPIVRRLQERTTTWPTELLEPDHFTIYAAYEVSARDGQLRSTGGLLIWVDFADHRGIRLTLGAQVDDRGLRCGPVEPSRPDYPTSANLTWFTRPIAVNSLDQTADDLLGWFALEARRWQQGQAPAAD
jgi:hypothetical protein